MIIYFSTSRSQEQATRREQKRRAGLSLTSYIAERKRNNAPLLPILEDDSDEDSDAWEDEIPLQIRMDLAKLDDAEQKKYAENHLPYSANMFVSYVPEDPDIEPEATYDLRNAELLEREYEEMDEEEKKKYIFSFYAGTCSKRVCPWLTDSDGIKKSTILKLMAAGQVCWRKVSVNLRRLLCIVFWFTVMFLQFACSDAGFPVLWRDEWGKQKQRHALAALL